MTGPVSDPPPGGPGRLGVDLFGDYADQLSVTGCEVIDPLTAAIEAIAAAAPPLSDSQEGLLSRVFGSKPRLDSSGL